MAASSRHVPSPLLYFLVFLGLLVLTGTTVLVASVKLGQWHTTIALAIATCKAALIVLFFMHGLESSKLTWVVIAGAVLWLAIMLAGTLSDYWTREVDREIRNPTVERKADLPIHCTVTPSLAHRCIAAEALGGTGPVRCDDAAQPIRAGSVWNNL
jgi:cytochrome c oxidase subunit 4